MRLISDTMAEGQRAWLETRKADYDRMKRQCSMYQHVAANCHYFSVKATKPHARNYWQDAAKQAAHNAQFRLQCLIHWNASKVIGL